MTGPTPLQFCRVVVRPSAAALWAWAGVLALAAYLARTDVEGLDQAAGVALLLQMFAASTGFRDAARRGHFDAVLTGGSNRAALARAHAACSLMPGLVVWLAIAGLEAAVRPDRIPTALTPAGLSALAYVSVLAWAVGVTTKRYAAGGAWLLSLVALAAADRLDPLRAAFATGGIGLGGAAAQARAALLCPVFLVGYPGAARAGTVAFVTAVACLSFAAGCWSVVHLDLPLEDVS